MASGLGNKTLSDGTIFEGNWISGEIKTGKCIFPSGIIYTGQFEEGKLDGTGEMVWPNGRKYNGEFYDGKPNGRGTKIDA